MDPANTLSTIMAIIVALGGGVGLGAFVTSVINNKITKEKIEAETVHVYSNSEQVEADTDSKRIENLFRIMDRMEQDYNTMLKRIQEQGNEIDRLNNKINLLEKQLNERADYIGLLRKDMATEVDKKKYLIDIARILIGQLFALDIEPEAELPEWACDED